MPRPWRTRPLPLLLNSVELFLLLQLLVLMFAGNRSPANALLPRWSQSVKCPVKTMRLIHGSCPKSATESQRCGLGWGRCVMGWARSRSDGGRMMRKMPVCCQSPGRRSQRRRKPNANNQLGNGRRGARFNPNSYSSQQQKAATGRGRGKRVRFNEDANQKYEYSDSHSPPAEAEGGGISASTFLHGQQQTTKM